MFEIIGVYMNRLAITKMNIKNKAYTAYVLMDEARRVEDFQLFPLEEQSCLNQICVARVENIVSNISAAFVKLGPDTRAYLPLEDFKSPLYCKKQSPKKDLSIGDEIIVQVVKEAVKTKDAVVSTKLTLAGSYCLLTTDNTALSISKKIKGALRENLLSLLAKVEAEAKKEGFGIILRTNAQEVSPEVVEADLWALIARFLELKAQGIHRAAFSVLEKEPEGFIRKLKSAALKNIDKIYTDDPETYNTIVTELPYLKEQGLLELYKDPMVSLKTLYNLEGAVEELVHKKVWLKSGANIIIEQLETLTVIDVNTGKNMSKSPKAMCEVNKEAAKELARQLRLRNISGMILIDFINMKSKEEIEEVVEVLKLSLKNDPIPAGFIDVTKLGIVEVTRKKVEKSLLEIIL